MRVAVQAGIDSQVEDSTMEPNRRRLAQLELEMVLNLEANYSLLEHISELRRTLQASEEEKLEDHPLISRGRARLAEQEAEARRLDAQQEGCSNPPSRARSSPTGGSCSRRTRRGPTRRLRWWKCR
ncbi:unnamed protein product [Effrenium voratum]|nr:unnamed protein product [Effrenium voratum]